MVKKDAVSESGVRTGVEKGRESVSLTFVRNVVCFPGLP